MPKLNPVWADGLYIGTSKTDATPPVWTYSQLCEGVKGMTFGGNETLVTEHYLCGNGGANTEVTGIAPVITVTCDRVNGNAAQDYIVSKLYSFGDDRKTSVKVVEHGKQTICDATIANIVPFGGNSVELNAFTCELRLNGIPTVTDVA